MFPPLRGFPEGGGSFLFRGRPFRWDEPLWLTLSIDSFSGGSSLGVFPGSNTWLRRPRLARRFFAGKRQATGNRSPP